ncbi:MAG: polymer-forming cytoskeletal protein [Betaproteobacteria bacterium]|nr:polymer-forming cytoskeletal protein [Betaproteobacteria bacterium]
MEGQRPGAHETVIAGDYFGTGTNASPGSTVEGDAFVAGGQVDLNKPVNGDALLAGGGVSISERVGGDLYATGGSVVIDAPIAGNARLAGGHVEITRRGQVSGKTTLVGGRVTVMGKAGRQLAVFGEHVTLDGEVAGNVTIASRTLSIGPNARVSGKLTYRGSVPAQIDPAAVIIGGINYLSFDFEDETYRPVARVVAWVGVIAFTVGLFLIGILVIIVAPESTAHTSKLGRARPISSLAMGLVTILCAPIAIVLLMLTIVGIPFAFMLLLAWPIILILGYLAGVMAVSDAIAGPSAGAKGRRIFLLAMGLGVMLLFARVPFAGWFIGMLLLVMGVGAMALNAMGVSVPVKIRKETRVVPIGETEPVLRREPTFRVD